MKIRRLLALGWVLIGLFLITFDYPWAPRAQEGEVRLWVRFQGCTCPPFKIVEGTKLLQSGQSPPKNTRFNEIFLSKDSAELPFDSSADHYWLVGKIIGYEKFARFDKTSYPVFQARIGKHNQFHLSGFVGMFMSIISLLGLLFLLSWNWFLKKSGIAKLLSKDEKDA